MITRRFFLCGSAAAVALASAPIVLIPTEVIVPVVAPVAFARRQIEQLAFYPGGQTGMVTLTLRDIKLKYGVGYGGSVIWAPCPDGIPVQFPDEVLTMDFQAIGPKYENEVPMVNLIVTHYDEEGNSKSFTETHTFHGDHFEKKVRLLKMRAS